MDTLSSIKQKNIHHLTIIVCSLERKRLNNSEMINNYYIIILFKGTVKPGTKLDSKQSLSMIKKPGK